MQPQAPRLSDGSGALAGNSFAIDRNANRGTISASRKSQPTSRCVSDRDFALDYLFALTAIATHLSRLAEDFVLFASQEFSYVILPDEYSTGSSLMPQKRIPTRGSSFAVKPAAITGALVALLTTLKGLPTSYQRDLQEDKEALFGAHDQSVPMLAVAPARSPEPNFARTASGQRLAILPYSPPRLRTIWFTKGIPFRQAHDLVGKVLREAEKQIFTGLNCPRRPQEHFSHLGLISSWPVRGKRHCHEKLFPAAPHPNPCAPPLRLCRTASRTSTPVGVGIMIAHDAESAFVAAPRKRVMPEPPYLERKIHSALWFWGTPYYRMCPRTIACNYLPTSGMGSCIRRLSSSNTPASNFG